MTLLFLVVGLALVGSVGGGTYGLLGYYFKATTELALKHKMAHELRVLGAAVPAELVTAEDAWYSLRNQALPGLPAARTTSDGRRREGEEHEREERDRDRRSEDEAEEESYDGELAAVIVLPVGPDGRLVAGSDSALISPEPTAVLAALRTGNDSRTVTLSDGRRARLLTYPTGRANGIVVLQLGRILTDQERILGQTLAGLLLLGGLSTIALTAGSYWLAGRSLRPTEQAWERQQAFVASAGHELRTPLTLIRASAEVGLRYASSTSDEQRELWSDVLQECDHVARLVDDLVLLSRLDSGHLRLEPQRVALRDLVDELQRKVARLATERGIRFEVDAECCAVWADPERLRQVLLILLDNALRHTPSGGTIRLQAQSLGERVVIKVED
ncbi:MAG: HAMP domain-containing histidine kinase, partial [Chloroflexi bacterium]|nr:HAMP domain-containing histidine kinase [Chloroflexota bacterium]